MDPLNVVLKGSKGMLNLKLVQRPLIPEDAKLEATFRFKMDMSHIKEWRKSGQNVEARMCRLDSYDAYQSWPNSLSFKVNGRQAFSIKEPKPGHKRRDLPHRISANLKPGVNTFEVEVKDQNVQRYALALVRTSPLVPREMCKHVPCLGVEDCKQRVKDLLFSSMLEGCVEEFQAAASDRSRLLCPITMSRIRTPARGKKCRHLQCFDLEAYLVSNQRMSVMNKRWLCPVCNLNVKPPGDLFIDTFIVQILAETGECDEEVAFDSTASWTVTAVAASPVSDSEDELPIVTEAPPRTVENGNASDVAVSDEEPEGSPDHSDVEAVDMAGSEDNDVDEAGAANAEEDNDVDEAGAANAEDNDVGDRGAANAEDNDVGDRGAADAEDNDVDICSNAGDSDMDDGGAANAEDNDIDEVPAKKAPEWTLLEDAELCGDVLDEAKMTEVEAKDKAAQMKNCFGFTYSKKVTMPAMMTFFAKDGAGKGWTAAKGWRSWQKAVELDDRPNATPAGSPSASSMGVEASPDASGSPDDSDDSDVEGGPAPDCQSDPYMMPMKDDDDVDEDFVATLTGSPTDGDQSVKSSGSNGHRTKLMSMIKTPAPLASPTPGIEIASPGEASDPDDPLGLSKHMSPKQRVTMVDIP